MTHPTPLYASGKVKRSRTEAFEHTINGLLTKRADLFNEAERLRDRQANRELAVLYVRVLFGHPKKNALAFYVKSRHKKRVGPR